jgi:K+-transporting ATPase ATPase B chain
MIELLKASRQSKAEPGRKRAISVLEPAIIKRAAIDSFAKLDPRWMVKNPVMFIVEIGSLLTTYQLLKSIASGNTGEALFVGQVTLWLWFTVLFANFAEAMAEGRGKAQADSLKKTRTDTWASKKTPAGIEKVLAADLRKDDLCVCEAGDVIPGDGEVIEGIASVDESVITGESAPVIRESGGDRSAVTGGTKVLSDRIVVRITSNPGETFIDRMIHLVESASRQKTPNEIALGILLSGLTIIFLLVAATLQPFALYSSTSISITSLIALLVCLIPTTIGGLLSAIGIAGIDRVMQHNVMAMSGRSVEASGDINTLLLDKTGTITLGNRQAVEFIPLPGIEENRLAEAAQLSSLSDETPEGRSIVVLAKRKYGLRGVDMSGQDVQFIPFSANTRISGINTGRRAIRKGASEAIIDYVKSRKGEIPPSLKPVVIRIADAGGTPLVVSENSEVLGVIYLKDVVKGGIRERFERLRSMGIKTVMITGDNPLTAKTIAQEAGVDDFLAEATPESKMRLIRQEQAKGNMVAMAGDGTNDAPALAQADVGLAMHSGTMAAKEAGNMIDLESNPTKLIEIVEIGKQILMTRGALTTFSIANDLAKYFAILPAIFASAYPQLRSLDIMHLHSYSSAILSAVIFNALVIVALIPVALKGVSYHSVSAETLLARNLVIFGAGGVIIPFIGIKLIDMAIVAMGFIR